MTCDETRNLLDGYVDGELDLVRNLEVERHAESCDRCGPELRNLKALRHSMSAPEMRFRAPEHLVSRVHKSLKDEARAQKAPRVRQLWAGLAYAAVLVAIFAVVVGVWRNNASQDKIADQVVASHVRSLMASHLFDVQSTDQHTVKPWFHGKLDYAPPITDFAAQGYPLVGGRLDYISGRSVAAVVYQRRQHPVNLFVWPTDLGDSNPRNSTRTGYNLIRWTKSGMEYWLISDLSDNELRAFAQLLQQ